MKHGSCNSLGPVTRDFAIRGGAVVFRVSGLPYGYDDGIALRRPVPPVKGFARDEKGKLAKDDETGRPFTNYDERDPGYVAALKQYNRRHAMHLIVLGLRHDPDVSFDVGHPPSANTGGQAPSPVHVAQAAESYADAIAAEIVAFGLTAGEVADLLDAIMDATGFRKEDVDAARADFLPTTARLNSTGATPSGSASESAPSST